MNLDDAIRELRASDVAYGIMEPVTITCPESHTDLFKVAEAAWTGFGVPRDLLPICESNADFYCMNSAGEVIYWSHNGWSPDRWPSLKVRTKKGQASRRLGASPFLVRAS